MRDVARLVRVVSALRELALALGVLPLCRFAGGRDSAAGWRAVAVVFVERHASFLRPMEDAAVVASRGDQARGCGGNDVDVHACKGQAVIDGGSGLARVGTLGHDDEEIRVAGRTVGSLRT